ncbi:MAG: DUF4149 domain-containing protein [Candidatus Eremiobacteraeota bacterium]|nr:DUF4149 domain-containing protein [Candidatus Eremiobacteraeota bacterium]
MNRLNLSIEMLRTLAMALWVGSMAGFAFIFAPTAFHTMGATPLFAATVAATIRATTVFGWACAALALLTTFLLPTRNGRTAYAFAGLVVVMGFLSFYEISRVVPDMEHTALHTSAYAALHQQSSTVYSAVLLLGIVALALASSTRQTPR